MAGRNFGTFDGAPFRTEGNVNPFSTFVGNGMSPSLPNGNGGKGAPSLGKMNPATVLPLLQLLMRGQKGGAQIPPQLMQQIMALLAGGQK